MDYEDGYLNGSGDNSIYYRHWRPQGTPGAILLVVHGIGEHCGRYMNLVDWFVPKGFAVYGLDHPGHGNSGGPRLHIDRFSQFTDALSQVHEMIREKHRSTPVFLVGHSMGGLISTHYLLDHQDTLTGAILSGPAVMVPEFVSPLVLKLGQLCSKVMPTMRLKGLDPNGISKDPAVVRAYLDDPLVCTQKVTARMADELIRAIRRVGQDCHKISLPLLILQGGADPLVNSAGARMLFDRAASGIKELKVYNGLRHEVFNEPERDMVFRDMEAWLSAHPGI